MNFKKFIESKRLQKVKETRLNLANPFFRNATLNDFKIAFKNRVIAFEVK